MTRLYAGIDDRTGAHRAGFQRHVQPTAGQSPTAQFLAGGVDRLDLGVSQRVFAQLAAVAAGADHLVTPHDHRPDRHLAFVREGGGPQRVFSRTFFFVSGGGSKKPRQK